METSRKMRARSVSWIWKPQNAQVAASHLQNENVYASIVDNLATALLKHSHLYKLQHAARWMTSPKVSDRVLMDWYGGITFVWRWWIDADAIYNKCDRRKKGSQRILKTKIASNKHVFAIVEKIASICQWSYHSNLIRFPSPQMIRSRKSKDFVFPTISSRRLTLRQPTRASRDTKIIWPIFCSGFLFVGSRPPSHLLFIYETRPQLDHNGLLRRSTARRTLLWSFRCVTRMSKDTDVDFGESAQVRLGYLAPRSVANRNRARHTEISPRFNWEGGGGRWKERGECFQRNAGGGEKIEYRWDQSIEGGHFYFFETLNSEVVEKVGVFIKVFIQVLNRLQGVS